MKSDMSKHFSVQSRDEQLTIPRPPTSNVSGTTGKWSRGQWPCNISQTVSV